MPQSRTLQRPKADSARHAIRAAVAIAMQSELKRLAWFSCRRAPFGDFHLSVKMPAPQPVQTRRRTNRRTDRYLGLASIVLAQACTDLPSVSDATELFRKPAELASSCVPLANASRDNPNDDNHGADWLCTSQPEFWVTPATAQTRPVLLEGRLGQDLLADLARGGLSARHRNATVALHRVDHSDRSGFRPFAALDRGQPYTLLFPERAEMSQPQVRRVLHVSPPPSQPVAAWPPREAHGVPVDTQIQHFLFRAEADIPETLLFWSPDASSAVDCILIDHPDNPFRNAAHIDGDGRFEGYPRSCALPSPLNVGRYRFATPETQVHAFSTWLSHVHRESTPQKDATTPPSPANEDEPITSTAEAEHAAQPPLPKLFDETLTCSVYETRVGPLCARPGAGSVELRTRTLEPVLARLEIPKGAKPLWRISQAGHLSVGAIELASAQLHSGRVTVLSLNFSPKIFDFTFETIRAPSSVQIVEVMANPAGDDALGEFVMLRNFGDAPIDLHTLYLTDNPSRALPPIGHSYFLLPGAVAALVPRDFDPSLLRFRPHVQATLYLEGNISHRGLVNTGGSLQLMDLGGNLLDTFVFGASGDDVCWSRGDDGGPPQLRAAGQCRYVYPREAIN